MSGVSLAQSIASAGSHRKSIPIHLILTSRHPTIFTPHFFYSTFALRNMLALRSAIRATRPATRTLYSQRFASSLVYLEHKGGKLNDSSLNAVTAAQKVDGEVCIVPYMEQGVVLTLRPPVSSSGRSRRLMVSSPRPRSKRRLAARVSMAKRG